jgi:RHS repeat-associated protein
MVTNRATYYAGRYYSSSSVTVSSVTTTNVQKHYNLGQRTVAVRTIVTKQGATTNTLNWILADHLGSAAVTANEDGTLNSRLRYTAFGERREASDDGTPATKHRYTDQMAELETGLLHYRSRWYDPKLSHFLQADTVIPDNYLAISYQRYAYVRYSPIIYSDYSGHCWDPLGCFLQIAITMSVVAITSTIVASQTLASPSTKQALDLVPDWFGNQHEKRVALTYGDPLTLELMNHQGVRDFKEEWKNNGSPASYGANRTWEHQVDAAARNQPYPQNYLGGASAFISGNLDLYFAVWGIPGSNAIDGVLGSYWVGVEMIGEGSYQYTVTNLMSWGSITRPPGTTTHYIDDQEDAILGANVWHTFTWVERTPTQSPSIETAP